MRKNQTIFIKKSEVKRERYLVDAAGAILGRLATKVATYLCGKHKPIFSPQADCGDFIVVVNAEKVRVSGRKAQQKTYFTHSGYPGGDRLIAFDKLQTTKPARIIELAIRGMLPKNRLGDQLIKKLTVLVGPGSPGQTAKLKKLEV
jgi:large subunit ribosomal protein L13